MAAKKAKKSKKAPAKKPAKKVVAKAKAKTPKKATPKAPPKPKHPQIVHWEIQSQSPAALHDFYARAFGWVVNTDNPMNYGLVASGGAGGIAGGIGGSPGAEGSRVVVYAQVPSIDETLARIAELGGRMMVPRTDIGPVIMALYSDPEGNVMGLIEG